MFGRFFAFFLLFITLIISGCDELKGPDTSYVVLTWTDVDTATTMTVNYRLNRKSKSPTVHYDVVSRNGDPAAYRFKQEGHTDKVAGLKKSYFHQVKLENLVPNATYYFVVGDEKSGYSRERKFKTLHTDDRPYKFINGGDMGTTGYVIPLLKLAAAESPDFGVIGGDIAYGNGEIENWALWVTWMQNWDNFMVTPEGYSIPFMAAIGNHEVKKFPPVAPFFNKVLNQDSKSYFKRKVGTNTMFYMLDTGHQAWQVGPQLLWMKHHFKKDKNIQYKFPIYHIPLYPSHRKYKLFQSQIGRTFWAPVFEKYGIHTAFEHHDHSFKRTHYIKKGKVVGPNDGGILYIGDGCFGRDPRDSSTSRWYLAANDGVEHFWSVTVHRDGVHYRAVDSNGNTVDDYTRPNN